MRTWHLSNINTEIAASAGDKLNNTLPEFETDSKEHVVEK